MKQGVCMTALCICLSLALCYSSGLAGHSLSGNMPGKPMGLENPEAMRQYAQQLASWHEKREAMVHDALRHQFTHEHFLRLIDREISPGHKMLTFRNEAMKRRGKGLFSKLHSEQRDGRREQVNSQWGDISGYVTVGGDPVSVTVVAFDEQGSFVNEGYSAITTGGYYLISLPVGFYYIMTFSDGHRDEFYDDVPALLGSLENWRQATLVEVRDGENTENIDFDLQPGVTVTGTVYEADGVTPLEVEWGFFFRVYWADRFENVALLPQYVTADIGQYALTLPVTGDVKIFVETLSYRGEWYQEKTSWEQADPISLPALGDTVSGIDFSLEPMTIGGDGSVSGMIFTGDGSDTLDYAFVVAFDMADTTIAGFALSTDGSYTISGLQDGEYIIYCDDIPLTTFGQENRIGEYYRDAPTPSQATVVVISGQNQVEGVDFTLEVGGAISGTVMGPGGAPMDSILVLAFHADILVWDPFLSHVQFGFAMTDDDGNYHIDGLPSGEYILRTVTLPPLYLDLAFGEISIPGEHYGKVVDEYYDGVQNVLDLGNADRVTVVAPNVATGIDFTLEAAGAISGSVKAADDTTYTPGGFIIAFDAETRLPQALAVVEWDTYQLGPLPAGEYVVFDLVMELGLVKVPSVSNRVADTWNTDDLEPIYLSEFYDNARYFDDATPVNVTPDDTTAGIDFLIDLGARLEGIVHLSAGYPAGADTLWGFPVIAYDAASGNMAGMSWVSFSGGYTFSALPEGSYKVCALPAFSAYGVTYYGGGQSFDDPSSAVINITSASTHTADIILIPGQGSITGYVHDAESGLPVTSSMVLAYDQSGHIAGLGFAGYDWIAESTLDNNGGYEIPGLRTGQYSVRTWSLMSLMVYIKDLLTGARGEFIDIASLFSFESELDLGGHMHEDEWYGDISIPVLDYDLFEMLNEMVALGFGLDGGLSDLPLLMPSTYIGQPHGTQVSVAEPQETPNINFNLKPMEISGFVTEVENNSGNEVSAPDAFGLDQNYPNPFNPTTHIQYAIPSKEQREEGREQRKDSGHGALRTTLKIYNLLGQEVRTLVNEVQDAGYYAVTWDGRDSSGVEVGSGVYFYRLTIGDYSVAKRMVLVK